MDDDNKLNLGYYPINSPDVSSPDVLGDIDPASFFPSVNWILTINLYVALYLDYSRLVMYIFWMI